jgi:hypothetical protein
MDCMRYVFPHEHIQIYRTSFVQRTSFGDLAKNLRTQRAARDLF